MEFSFRVTMILRWILSLWQRKEWQDSRGFLSYFVESTPEHELDRVLAAIEEIETVRKGRLNEVQRERRHVVVTIVKAARERSGRNLNVNLVRERKQEIVAAPEDSETLEATLRSTGQQRFTDISVGGISLDDF